MAGIAYALNHGLNIQDVTVKTSSGDVVMANEGAVVVNKSSGAATQVTLTPSPESGMFRWVIDAKGDAATNNITVVGAASETINGASSHVISENYGVALYFYNGTEWNVVGVYASLAAAELAFLNGVTAGTGLASKAVVLDANGDVTMPDLGSIGFGGVAKVSWDTTDANANQLLVQLPAGGATDVPVVVFGQGIEAVDSARYDGVTEPRIALYAIGATATGNVIETRKSRGTFASPTVVTSGDDCGAWRGFGCVAAGEYVQSCEILMETTGTVATTRGPGVMTFKTATDAAPSVLTNAMTIGANQAVTALSGLVAKSQTAAAITTTRTLTAADSGGVFSVAKTSAYAITLPTPAQGLRFKFMVLDTGANIVTISNGSAHLMGAVSINNVSTAMTGTTLGLASGGSVGDWVEFEGIDATHYLVTGACIAAADITIT